MANNNIKIINAYNAGDEYYFDLRCLFEYRGKTFGMIMNDSISGYIPYSLELGYVTQDEYESWLHSSPNTYSWYPDTEDLEMLKKCANHMIEDNVSYLTLSNKLQSED